MLINFYEKLQETPNDWELRSIFADWLFDNDMFELEKVQRWMIENKKYPMWYEKVTSKEKCYIWGTEENDCWCAKGKKYFDCALPKNIFAKSQRLVRDNIWLYYDKFIDAELDLSKCL